MVKVHSSSHVGHKSDVDEALLRKEDEEENEEIKKIKQIDTYIDICRSLINHPLISDRTRTALEDGWQVLRASKNVDWMKENVEYLPRTISEAEKYFNSFTSQIDHAIAQGWLGKDKREEWVNRFFDPSLLEMERKHWLTTQFPRYIENWKSAAEERAAVLAEAKRKGIHASHIPELSELSSDSAFLKLHYRDRVAQIAKIRALMTAWEKNEVELMRSAEKTLKDAAKSGIMHSSKIGPWMKRIANSGDPRAFMATVLTPFIENWRAVRADFDRVNKALDKDGIPRGFRPVQEKDFLLMEYKQRTSYCALAWAQLEDAEGQHETDKLLAARKLAIRHCLNTQDWEGAESLLTAAQQLQPQDAELRSMHTYLTCHRKDGHEAKTAVDPMTNIREIREALSGMHSSQAQQLAMKTLSLGPAAFNRFAQVYGNFGWCVEVAQMSEKDLRHRSELQHTAGMPGTMIDPKYQGIDIILADITAHPDESAGKTPPNLSGHALWGYWHTWVPDVPMALYRDDRQKISQMKYLLRSLHAAGGCFSMTGSTAHMAA